MPDVNAALLISYWLLQLYVTYPILINYYDNVLPTHSYEAKTLPLTETLVFYHLYPVISLL